MINKILVSLVSDQTTPNVNFIKIQKDVKEYWFITTAHSEGRQADGTTNPSKVKSDWIINCCNIADKSKKIEVVEDDLYGIRRALQSELDKLNGDSTFILNMTCGTKMMSLAAYLFFKDITPHIFYMPIGADHFKSISSGEMLNIQPMSISEHLGAYGIRFKSKVCLKDRAYVRRFFEFYQSSEFDTGLIYNIRMHYRGRNTLTISEVESFEEVSESDRGKRIPNLGSFLKKVGFETLEQGKLQKKEIEFLTGGWFEEYVYHIIKAHHRLQDDYLLLGVELIRSEITNTNDLDVVLILNNKLIVVECKTGIKVDGKTAPLFNETVYKAAALKKNFGLNVASYLFTLENLSEGEWRKKANVLGINLVDRAQIVDFVRLSAVIDKL